MSESVDLNFDALSGPPEVIEQIKGALILASTTAQTGLQALQILTRTNDELRARVGALETSLSKENPTQTVAEQELEYQVARAALLQALAAPRDDAQAQADAILEIVSHHALAIRAVYSRRFDAEWAALNQD